MALSDFMPYGAPELLAGASPRMARATLAASGLVAAAVWLAGAIALQFATPEPEVVLVPPFVNRLMQPPKWREPGRESPTYPASTAPRSRVDAVPRPVPDPPAPQEPLTDPS